MSVLGAIAQRGSLNDTSHPLTASALSDWMTGGFGGDSGVPVTESSIYGLSAWFRSIRIISGTIAALPLHVYQKGTRERARGYALDEPSPGIVTPFEFWQTMYANALSWGNAEGQIAAFFTMVVAAAEVVVGLAIIVNIYRTRRSTSVDNANLLKL